MPLAVELELSGTRQATAMGLVPLALWRAFLLATPGHDGPRIHVVGVNMRTGCSRVSSPVARLDASARTLITQSGRAYALVGEHGPEDLSLGLLQRLTVKWDAMVVADVTALDEPGWTRSTTRPRLS